MKELSVTCDGLWVGICADMRTWLKSIDEGSMATFVERDFTMRTSALGERMYQWSVPRKVLVRDGGMLNMGPYQTWEVSDGFVE